MTARADTADWKALVKQLATAIGREDWSGARAASKAISRLIPGSRVRLVEDRVEWIRDQMAEVTAAIETAGVRDVQGTARLRSELRMLREAYDEELDRRQSVSVSGTASELEEALISALVEVEEDRLGRVLGEVARRRGRDLASLGGGE